MGLVGNMDLTDNMMLRSFRQGHSPFTRPESSPGSWQNDVVEESGGGNSRGFQHRYGGLSGGNVQKVLVGREIASAPTVLIDGICSART